MPRRTGRESTNFSMSENRLIATVCQELMRRLFREGRKVLYQPRLLKMRIARIKTATKNRISITFARLMFSLLVVNFRFYDDAEKLFQRARRGFWLKVLSQNRKPEE